jgi:hypothetical protein
LAGFIYVLGMLLIIGLVVCFIPVMLVLEFLEARAEGERQARQ